MGLSLDISLELADFSLNVAHKFPEQGITAIFGASGAGKSTLFRIIAGLETRATGRVAFGEEIWQAGRKSLPAAKRGAGLVFQEARLFEHLSVEDNLKFAAKRSRSSQFDTVVKTLDLRPLLARKTTALSGGERQRVAIGRTLLSAPRLLLMDEPLAALDHSRKARLLPYIARLPEAFNLPILYITHSVEEVTRLADRMLVLSKGQVLAAGAVSATLARLDIAEASGKFEAGSVVHAQVIAQDERFHLTELRVAGQSMSMPASDVAIGAELRLRIRARDVAIALQKPAGVSIRNILGGVIEEIIEEPDTAFAEVLINIGTGQHLRARLTRASVFELELAVGRKVFALIKSVSFDRRVLPKK